ncbi:MAG: hypothetical protein HGA90_07545 [Alphaproteobacteria bacterium]|nr:hypothetical protein [Alphaproteobacteria bacterium]
MKIELASVTKRFGTFTALGGVSLTNPSGTSPYTEDDDANTNRSVRAARHASRLPWHA